MAPRRVWMWIAAVLIFVLLMLVTPRIPQDEAYHQFADSRTLLGIPNALNVLSNLPFLVIGAAGIFLTLQGKRFGFTLEGEILGWTSFFLGVAATGVGSSYYHLRPDDSRLVWDRLPMTISFTAIMAVFVIERVDERKGKASVLPLLAAGAVSVAYWRWANDLRPYALVQFVPCLAIPVMAICLPSQYTHSSHWLWAAGFYLLAKLAEAEDKPVYSLTRHVVSGHTLKHLLAALVPVFIMVMLAHRQVSTDKESLKTKWVNKWRGPLKESSKAEESSNLLPSATAD